MNNVTSILNFIREFFEIPVLEIDENNMDAVLTAFEREHCISPELQTPLTKEYLKAFFSRQKEQNIYNLQDKTGAHIIVIPLFSQWILIGPYMEEDPSSSNNISHYKTLNPFSVMKAVDIMIHEITPENTLYRHEYLRPPKPSGLEEPEEYMEKFYETDLPHSYEQQYMAGLRSGDYETSLYYWEKICRKKPHVDFLRSIKDNAMTILSSYFLILSQLAAREAGLSDEYITELAKRYGEKLYATTDETTIHILTEYMIGELCLEIRKSKKKNHNVYIRRAISYIEKNSANLYLWKISRNP